MSTIRDYIASNAEMVEAALIQALPAQWNVPASLRESMNYSLMAGGKRLRPILVLAAAEALGDLRQRHCP